MQKKREEHYFTQVMSKPLTLSLIKKNFNQSDLLKHKIEKINVKLECKTKCKRCRTIP